MYRVWNFVTNYSLLLIAGALIALVWANTHPESYHHLVHFTLIDHFFIGHAHYDAAGQVAYRTLTLHYLVNDVLMAFFFAIAAKEVWEAVILENGSLRGDTTGCDAWRDAGANHRVPRDYLFSWL